MMLREGNDLTRGFGELLKANLKDAKGINVAMSNAFLILYKGNLMIRNRIYQHQIR